MVGQAAHQPNSVDEHDAAAVGQQQGPGSGVQGGEQLVLRQHPRVSQGVEQGGFPHIGVPHDGHGGDTVLFAAGPQVFPVAGQAFQPFLQGVNPGADVPPVGFQLGFARAPGADASPLPGEDVAKTGQPGQQVPLLGQFHLELALAGAGPLGEDVQDQHGAVQHRGITGVLDVAQLGRGQLVVKDHHVRLGVLAEEGQFRQPPGADAGGDIHVGALLHHPSDDLGSGGGRQLLQLIQGDIDVVFPSVHRHQDGSLRFYLIFVHSISSCGLAGALYFYISLEPLYLSFSNSATANPCGDKTKTAPPSWQGRPPMRGCIPQ